MALRREIGTIRLEFGEDWIEVRSERKYGDTVVAQRAAASKVQAKKGKGKKGAAAQFEFDVSAFNLSLLVQMIIAWSDKEPINEDTVQELPNDIIQRVLEVIGERGDDEEEDTDPLERSSSLLSEQPEESLSPPKEPRGLEE